MAALRNQLAKLVMDKRRRFVAAAGDHRHLCCIPQVGSNHWLHMPLPISYVDIIATCTKRVHGNRWLGCEGYSVRGAALSATNIDNPTQR